MLAMLERSITGAELMRMLPEILEDIAQRGTVFLVHMGSAADAGSIISGLVSATNEIVFAVGAPHMLGEVFGLIDAEYGWPHPISLGSKNCVGSAAGVPAASDDLPWQRVSRDQHQCGRVRDPEAAMKFR
jgi:hypothetical protein